MSHQEHFFLEYMPAVFTSPKSPVVSCGTCDTIQEEISGFELCLKNRNREKLLSILVMSVTCHRKNTLLITHLLDFVNAKLPGTMMSPLSVEHHLDF